MKPPARRLIRDGVRALPAVVGTLAAGALFAGFFSDLAALGPWQLTLLLALLASIVVLAVVRLRRGPGAARPSWREEAEFGALVLVAAYAVSQPMGGVDSLLFPVVYLVLAFLVIFLPGAVGFGLTALAVLIDVALFATAGLLATRWSLLLAHTVFFALFAALSRVVFLTQEFGGLASGSIAVLERQRRLEERARQFRLGLAAAEEDGPLDEGEWVKAAVQEVEEAVNNALEVAECALHTHTVAVFLLSGDDRRLLLHDCRSLADDVIRVPFEPHEGVLGAVLKRRMAIRLCGEIKGISWYAGRKAVRSVLIVPLIDRRGAGLSSREEGFVRGVVIADRLEPVPFTEDDERLLAATSREVLRSIDTERVMGTVRRANARQKQFYDAIKELNTCSKIGEVLETTLRLAQGVTRLDLLAFTTFHEGGSGRVHRVEKVSGLDKFAQLEGHSFADNNGLVANAIRYEAILPGRELKVLEKPQIFDASTSVRGLLSLKIVPVRAGGKPIGALVCGARRRRAVEGDAVRLLEVIAMQAGEALLRARLFAQTEMMATTDGLTGLLNHRTFQAKFDEELARAARSGRKVTLLLTDIDHFKSINDTWGHATGDAVLRVVAKILSDSARTTDTVARYGGEEFAIVLPETDMEGGKMIAERIRKTVMDTDFQSELGGLKCTMSIGIATYPDVSNVKQVLFETADQCLYHCKRTGRNRTATVDDMRRSDQSEDAA